MYFYGFLFFVVHRFVGTSLKIDAINFNLVQRVNIIIVLHFFNHLETKTISNIEYTTSIITDKFNK